MLAKRALPCGAPIWKGLINVGKPMALIEAGAFTGGRITWVEPIQFEQEALSRAAKVVADHVEAHAVAGVEDLLEVAEGFTHTGLGIADAEDRVIEHRA